MKNKEADMLSNLDVRYGDINGGKIICSAIYYNDHKHYSYQPKNIIHGFVLKSYRHHNVIALTKVFDRPDLKKLNPVQGFITEGNLFVDRKTALMLAVKHGQVDISIFQSTRQLMSEDIWSKDSKGILCIAYWYDDGKKHVNQLSNIESGYVIAGEEDYVRSINQIMGVNENADGGYIQIIVLGI